MITKSRLRVANSHAYGVILTHLTCYSHTHARGAKQGGVGGGVWGGVVGGGWLGGGGGGWEGGLNPLNFGWGVEHLSSVNPP